MGVRFTRGPRPRDRGDNGRGRRATRRRGAGGHDGRFRHGGASTAGRWCWSIPLSLEAWEQLRTWRTGGRSGQAGLRGVRRQDAWLIAAPLPTHEPSLLAISGIGPVKLENYGDELIAMAEKIRSI